MLLACPVCLQPLKENNNIASCPRNHCFDFAKSGYINLLVSGKAVHGDDAAMVKSRTSFLASGAYGFLRDTLCNMVLDYHPSVLVDAGCGEGYYTSKLPCGEKYGFDLSKTALRHAAKNDKSTMYCLASIFHMPLPDACVDVALTCFAPFASNEITRILKTGGAFIYVTPGPRHLFEMKSVLYDNPYENFVEDIDTSMSLTFEKRIESQFLCDHENLMSLFQMTPYAWRTSIASRQRLEALDSLRLTAQFVIRSYQKGVR